MWYLGLIAWVMCRCWLLSACAYNNWQQGNKHLTADMCLTRNSCLINGWENSGQCFCYFCKTTRSTRQSVIRGLHIYKQIWRPLVREILTLEREEGNNHGKFPVSLLKHATVLGHDPNFHSMLHNVCSNVVAHRKTYVWDTSTLWQIPGCTLIEIKTASYTCILKRFSLTSRTKHWQRHTSDLNSGFFIYFYMCGPL